jgi:hypothetical protein
MDPRNHRPTTVKRSSLLAAAALSLLSAFADASPGEDLKFLPFLGARLEAARYAPADAEFSWVGWIGATADLVEKGDWSVYFQPDVETVLGHRVRSFEAVQANYSLEVGLHRKAGRVLISPFFHHVSRHVQDRDHFQAIDWNFLGARLDSPWPQSWKRRGAWSASLALATLTTGVDYSWEARLSGDLDLARKGNKALFLLSDLRSVGASPTKDFPRDRVTDFRGELGFRHWQQSSQFALFVAYEHRSDALITRALVINRALFGFRIRSERRAVPASDPIP